MADSASIMPSRRASADAANSQARAMVRRRGLAECLLHEVLGIEWWKVHREAMRFDAALSPDVEERIAVVLGDPGSCPHGNPIPGSANIPDQSGAIRLADAPIGAVEVVRIGAILEHDDEALQVLQACGFLPGRDAEVRQRRDGWIEVAGALSDAALPPHISRHTFVLVRE